MTSVHEKEQILEVAEASKNLMSATVKIKQSNLEVKPMQIDETHNKTTESARKMNDQTQEL